MSDNYAGPWQRVHVLKALVGKYGQSEFCHPGEVATLHLFNITLLQERQILRNIVSVVFRPPFSIVVAQQDSSFDIRDQIKTWGLAPQQVLGRPRAAENELVRLDQLFTEFCMSLMRDTRLLGQRLFAAKVGLAPSRARRSSCK